MGIAFLSRLRLAAGIGALALFISCAQNLDEANWDVDLLAPLLTTRLELSNLLPDTILVADSEGRLRLIIERPLIDLNIDSLIDLPDTTIVQHISLPVSLPDIAPGYVIPAINNFSRYDLGELQLKRVVVKGGILKVRVKNFLPTDVILQYSLPYATLNGAPLLLSERVAAGGSEAGFYEFTLDLTGYDMDLRGPNANSWNRLDVSYSLQTAPDGIMVTVPANQEFFTIEYELESLIPYYVTGYFGQQTSSSLAQNTPIDALRNFTSGQLMLDSVTIDLDVENGLGADGVFNLGALRSKNTRSGNTINLSYPPLIGTPLQLTRAMDMDGTPGGVLAQKLSFKLDNATSNVKAFIENLPDQLEFDISFSLNPLGNVSASHDFLYYDRPFRANVRVDVPLRARVDGLTLVDTLDWDLGATGVAADINSTDLKIRVINGFPFSAEPLLTLLDSMGNTLTQVLAGGIVSAPSLDVNGKVAAPLESIVPLVLTTEAAALLPLTRKVEIRFVFNTTDQPNLVQLYDGYALDVKIFGNINYQLNGQ